jgi:hypothetical protein
LERKIGLKFEKQSWEKLQLFSELYVVMAVRVNNSRHSAMSRTLTDYPAWKTLNLSLGLKGGISHQYYATIELRNILNHAYLSSKSIQNLPEDGFHIVASVGF